MRTKIMLLLSALMLSATVSAQFTPEKSLRNYGFFDNWFIGVNGGATLSVFDNFGNDVKAVGVNEFISPKFGITTGKWISPYTGVRVEYDYAKQRSQTYETNFLINEFTRHSVFTDVLLNLNQTLGGYKSDRKWAIIPFAGIGYINGIKSGKIGTTHNIATRLGLQLAYNFTPAWSINLEADGIATNEWLNSRQEGFKYDVYTDVSVGLSYRFKNPRDKKRNFAYLNSFDDASYSKLTTYVEDKDKALATTLADLENSQAIISKKDAEIAKLKNTLLSSINKQAPIELKSPTVFETVVEFAINSDNLESQQQANIYLIARQLISNSNLKVTLVGYADKQTGSEEFNKQLSIKRVNAVKNILVHRWKVSESKISVTAVGSEVQYFEANNWNRAVVAIFSLK
jgi:outer membrane protein OmpA-like peptidoglycan-associated protein